MRKIIGIYSITHIESGKLYIGSALNVEKRWSEHRAELTYNNHDNQRLQNAWNKYGPHAFEFKILEELPHSTSLLQREQHWMDKFQSYNRDKGFNIRKKAESNLGLKHKSETIERIRQKNIGKHNGQAGENNAFFGKVHTEESKQKMRRPKSDEAKKNITLAALERWKGHSLFKVCLFCQKAFETLKSIDNDFCSKICNLRYQGNLRSLKGTIEKTCLICSNTFITSISENKKYCSRKCWAVSMKGNKNQLGKRKTLKELFDSLSDAELKTVLEG